MINPSSWPILGSLDFTSKQANSRISISHGQSRNCHHLHIVYLEIDTVDRRSGPSGDGKQQTQCQRISIVGTQ